ncbi:hypothetical protein EV426DRAFT_621472 [Tirmania nivea]|nr:hypothetical protein EV426DRAFT_621472 [Tirmania nivea]
MVAVFCWVVAIGGMAMWLRTQPMAVSWGARLWRRSFSSLSMPDLGGAPLLRLRRACLLAIESVRTKSLSAFELSASAIQ